LSAGKTYGEKSEEALVEDLYKIAKNYKFEENVAGGDDGIFDNPRYLHRLALEISEYNYLRANGYELEDSILKLKTWIIMFSSMCTEYEDLKWLHKWHSKDASELRLDGCLDEIIGDALEYACARDKTDDMLKKRCRLLVRFFRIVQISESQAANESRVGNADTMFFFQAMKTRTSTLEFLITCKK
jgi:hypothetical protein